MRPVHFSESVAVANVRDHELNRFVSVCDRSADRRLKAGVVFGPVLHPVAYRDSVVCYLDSTKRKFRSDVHYVPKIRPKGFSETCYVLPRHTSLSCESTCDYHPNRETRRWYSASLTFDPKAFKSGIPIVDTDDVFADSPGSVRIAASPSDEAESRRGDERPAAGRHCSTVEVKVPAARAADDAANKLDPNNNRMAETSCRIRYRDGDGGAANDVFRSGVKVLESRG